MPETLSGKELATEEFGKNLRPNLTSTLVL